MSDIRVSVIMPFYNEEKYLSYAIDSILGQTYSAWELIIVNDGSTDGSEEIVKKYSDSRIRYFSYTPNKRKSYALNLGTENAKGDYIVVFDADDIASFDMLENEVKYLDSHLECICVGGAIAHIDEKGKVIQEKVESKYKTDIEIRTYELFRNCLTGGGRMYRRNVVQQYGLKYDEEAKSSQDYLFWINMLPYGEFAYIDKVVYYYRTGHLSQSQRIANANKEWYDNLMRKIFLHAWRQRGFELDESDIRFIHDLLYKRRFIWKPYDVYQGIRAYIKIRSQSKKLDLKEKKLIPLFFVKQWFFLYFDYFIHNRFTMIFK